MENYSFIPYNKSNQMIAFTKAYFDYIMKQEKWGDLHVLYSFYYYTGHWQKTNKVRAVSQYAAKGVNWTIERVRKIKKRLKELNLIEDIQLRKENGDFGERYIYINIVFSNILPDSAYYGETRTTQNHATNALTTNNINALKNNKENKETKTSFSSLCDESHDDNDNNNSSILFGNNFPITNKIKRIRENQHCS